MNSSHWCIFRCTNIGVYLQPYPKPNKEINKKSTKLPEIIVLPNWSFLIYLQQNPSGLKLNSLVAEAQFTSIDSAQGFCNYWEFMQMKKWVKCTLSSIAYYQYQIFIFDTKGTQLLRIPHIPPFHLTWRLLFLKQQQNLHLPIYIVKTKIKSFRTH